jgi:hypothetical protein
MTRTLALTLAFISTYAPAQAQEPKFITPAAEAAAAANVESPEDRVETLINQSAKFYDGKQRAKSGGALLEVAELVQDLAQPQPQRVVSEVEAFRQLALMAARGELNAHAVDFAAARAYTRLAALFADTASAKFENGKTKEAGQQWYRAIAFVERSIDWGGYTLKDAGVDALGQSKIHAQSLAEGALVEADEVRTQLADTRLLVAELGRSMAAKAGVAWDDSKADPRKAGGMIEDKSREVLDKVKGGAHRIGDLLKRWNR